MNDETNWPFSGNDQVVGMRLPAYLAWASGQHQNPKQLLLPPIQRGFVWKPWQIVELWDSLFRGMPIGSLMVNRLAGGQHALTLGNGRDEIVIASPSMGLLDGQQRTLAMLLSWPGIDSPSHCLWIDLEAEGHKGSPFEIRLTTKAQPFGFERNAHAKFSKYERKIAREHYDKSNAKETCIADPSKIPDYELWSLVETTGQEKPHPWKPGKTGVFVQVSYAWRVFRDAKGEIEEFLKGLSSIDAEAALRNLFVAFQRMENLQVPLILVPEHINLPTPMSEGKELDGTDTLVLLFERIGRNGASLSTQDLLFSMIKRRWPQAQKLINDSQAQLEVRAFMGPADYVMTAFRLAAAFDGKKDNARPDPNNFHRYLPELLVIGANGEPTGLLSEFIQTEGSLVKSFKALYKVLRYGPELRPEDKGLPILFLPHLPRGLVQVLLYWILATEAHMDQESMERNRTKLISFSLYWYLHVLNDDKASMAAFAVIQSSQVSTDFPGEAIYKKLIEAPEDGVGMAYPLMSSEELQNLLISEPGAIFLSYDSVFNEKGKDQNSYKQRELYKQFCWHKKPMLLWLQRSYITENFDDDAIARLDGLVDEDTVPYDFDHLCPQSHWGADWRHLTKLPNEDSDAMRSFRACRTSVGNCIGNLHLLESSKNRSFGDDPLARKLKKMTMHMLPDETDQVQKWFLASPDVKQTEWFVWDEKRLENFQNAVYTRASWLYAQYASACAEILQTE